MSYPTKSIYLCGPITGLTYGEAALGWREQFATLVPKHIKCFSPMRGKKFLDGTGPIQCDPKAYNGTVLASPKGVITRDAFDVRNCDVIVANFLGAKAVSIGSCHEFGMAHILNKPVVLIMEREGNVHNHIFITETAGYWVDNLEEAAAAVTIMLTPGI